MTLASSSGRTGSTKPLYVVTVGLPVTYDHPELVVLGTDNEDLHHAIVTGLGEQIAGVPASSGMIDRVG